MKSKNIRIATIMALFPVMLLANAYAMGNKPPLGKPSPSENSVDVNKNESVGKSIFDNKIILPVEVIYPIELPECLLVVDNGDTKNEQYYWTKVISDGEEIKPEFVNEITYQSIVDQSFVANASYLAFLNASAGKEDKFEIIVENILRAKGLPYTHSKIKAGIKKVMKDLEKKDREFYYIQAVNYSTVKHKTYKEVTKKAAFAGTGFGVDGKVYSSNSNFELAKVVSINYFPIQIVNEEPVQVNLPSKRNLPKVLNSIKRLDLRP